MFGKLGDMAGILAKVQQMKKNIKDMQDELARIKVAAESSDASVKVVVKGDFSVESVEILSRESENLDGMILEALNKALTEVRDKAKEKMGEVTGELGLPEGLI